MRLDQTNGIMILGVTPNKTTNQPGQTLYITKDDRVGIDRSSPQAKLHIGNNGPQWTTNGWRKALKLGNNSGLSDEDWSNPRLEHIQWLQDVQCNVGLGAWYYFLMASGNGTPPYYVHNYCAGEGTPGNLVIGMLDYFGGPGTSAGFDENDLYLHS